jgi:4-hydroxy-2-oxoheptanedioate aldolase
MEAPLMAYENPLIAKWRAGKPTFGAWLTTPDISIAEYFALSGFDEVTGDQQHSTIESNDLTAMFAAIELRGSVPSTRVPFNDYVAIGGALDLGAQMVIVPMVNNAAEAAKAVAAFRYPPRGNRSAGPVRPQHVMGGTPRELEGAACVLMVETKDGLANVDEIAATPGVDAIYIGPGDLALGLGMGWDSDSRSRSENEAFDAAVEHIRKTCERHGVTPGIHVGDADVSFRYAEQGFRLLTVASDIGLIFGGSAATLARVREARIPASKPAAARSGARSSAAKSAAPAQSTRAAKSAPKSAKPAKGAKSGKAPKTPI